MIFTNKPIHADAGEADGHGPVIGLLLFLSLLAVALAATFAATGGGSGPVAVSATAGPLDGARPSRLTLGSEFVS